MRFTFFSSAWADLLRRLYYDGRRASPRGQAVRELIGVSFVLEQSLNNILVHPVRNLNYRFMVAEWLWMWFGRDDVATIAKYNKQIAQFSDNGVNFNGAYGVPIKNHWPRLVNTLKADPDSRQAVLAIYRAPDGPTKDVPCTISVQFLVRRERLEVVVAMRSSDIWLGLPYDVFNFTMLGQCMAAELGVRPGSLTMLLGSSHLYERDAEKALQVLNRPSEFEAVSSPVLTEVPPAFVERVLVDPEGTSRTTFTNLPTSPWVEYCGVLASSKDAALNVLKKLGA